VRLFCFGFGYCASHYVAQYGHLFDDIAGTVRTDQKVARIAARHVDSAPVEVMVFDGGSPPPDLAARLAAADRILISIPPVAAANTTADASGDPVLMRLSDAVERSTPGSIVYLSTVGVYGDRGGAWVDETTPANPQSARSRARLSAERAWQALGTRINAPVAILRLAAIYGPGQNSLVNLSQGHARRLTKPGQVFNRIHVADIAQAIQAAFTRQAEGIFNVSDDEPAPPGDPIMFAAGLLGIAPPPELAFEAAAPTLSPIALSFYEENKRVRNERLKSHLGVKLIYPTYREGLKALHAARDA